LEQVDGAVEKGRLELALEIDIVSSSVVLVSIKRILSVIRVKTYGSIL
jgi:hypothetical protein